MRRNDLRRPYKPLLMKAGLLAVRSQDIRHTCAILMLRREGADVNTVSKMIGHSSVKVTLDVYAHVMPGM